VQNKAILFKILEPGCAGVDAFVKNWGTPIGLFVHPICLINSVLKKMVIDRVCGVGGLLEISRILAVFVSMWFIYFTDCRLDRFTTCTTVIYEIQERQMNIWQC